MNIISGFQCPKCGAQMALRHSLSSDTYFAGCVRYPNCKGTRHLSGAVTTATGKNAQDRNVSNTKTKS
jgi:ssDNA-binding Zn-finger/Zn-ribbon topoisomerase 1